VNLDKSNDLREKAKKSQKRGKKGSKRRKFCSRLYEGKRGEK